MGLFDKFGKKKEKYEAVTASPIDRDWQKNHFKEEKPAAPKSEVKKPVTKAAAKATAPKTEEKKPAAKATTPKTEEKKSAAKTAAPKTEEKKTAAKATAPKTEEKKTATQAAAPKTEEKKTATKAVAPKTEEKKTAAKATAPKTEEKKTAAKATAPKTEEKKTATKAAAPKSEEKKTATKAAAPKSEEKKTAAKTASPDEVAESESIELDTTEAVTESRATRNGKFDIRKAKDGRFFFNLYASNQMVIASSQMYSSSTAAINGIKSVMLNASKSELEDNTLQKKPEPKPFPKWEMYIDKAGEFRFRLYAPNGNCICHSHGYQTKSGCKGGMDSITRFATEDSDINKTYLK